MSQDQATFNKEAFPSDNGVTYLFVTGPGSVDSLVDKVYEASRPYMRVWGAPQDPENDRGAVESGLASAANGGTYATSLGDVTVFFTPNIVAPSVYNSMRKGLLSHLSSSLKSGAMRTIEENIARQFCELFNHEYMHQKLNSVPDVQQFARSKSKTLGELGHYAEYLVEK